jgi:hypothetical protein
MIATRPRYADTTACPDCRSTLPPAPFRCPTCGLPLQGFLAEQLLATLQEADDLLVRLRASAVAPVVTATAPPAPSAPRVDPDLPPMPVAPPPAPVRHGLQGASVPKILLGLGATCLLVAAIIFLAVAWTWLGVGGRTVVLVAMTAASGAGGLALGRRGLRVGAEALITVAFGLVVLDVVGADNAGWFGALSIEALVRLVGLTLFVPALALCLPRRRLVTPQLVAPLGLALVLGSIDWSAHAVRALDVGGLVSVLVLAGLVALARRLEAQVLAWVSGCLAAVVWGGSGLWALVEASDHPSVSALWVDGHGWELVAMSLLALLLWGVAWSEPVLRQGAAAFVAVALTYTVVLPGLDESATTVGMLAIGVVLTWAAGSAIAPRRWQAVPRVPLAAGAMVTAVATLYLVGASAVAVVAFSDPYTVSADVRIAPVEVELHPLLLVASVAALALAATLALPRKRGAWPASAAAVAVAGLVTLGLYPVPLWVVLGALALVAAGLFGLALRTVRTTASLAASGAAALGILVVVVALPSAVLTTSVLALIVTALGLTLVRGRFPLAAETAGLGLPPALGGLIWSGAEVAGVDPAVRAVPIMIVVGLVALVRARPEVEIAAAATGLAAAMWSITFAQDVSVSLAVHLTLAGVLVTTSSIVHPSRRLLAWPGGVLLAAATWVRLADLGVVAPEAYTLPSAVALLLVGLSRIHAAAESPTVPALAPGLVLATVPSLLWVLTEPVSLRATLLGIGCLAMLLIGVQLRWHAPVVVGALVGGIVVLRELAPYALQTPQWVVIGLAGTVLIVCGVTWESRMRDLQHAAAYLGRLR